MLPAEVIAAKRDGRELEPQELSAFLDGYRDGNVADYQVAAFLMAVYFRDLSADELRLLTREIVDSGRQLRFDDGGPPAVGKHSTGGVGDKVSLVLAPLLAEFGLRVPMISGRGLGHTGGTLDKLESIPGFRTDLPLARFEEVVDEVGCAMIGQTGELAPLDGRLYALRDVTATVSAIPLVAASVVSKKVAEGTTTLVLDVKFGRGAFFPDPSDAERLANTLLELAGEMGLTASAFLTIMDEPLGSAVGNALEVREAIACLRGTGPADLRMLTIALAAEVVSGAMRWDRAAARARLGEILDSGAALDRFRRLVELQGGDPRVVDDPEALPRAAHQVELRAREPGFVGGFDALEVGWTSVELGAGRRLVSDRIDPTVGIEILAKAGDAVEADQPLARVHARTASDAADAVGRLSTAVTVLDRLSEPPPLIWKRLSQHGRL
jgi:pyrimidine-nucleoside phosphorylase